MDKRMFDTKVQELAAKLKDSGVAISDAQAKQMAQDIIDTENKAIKKQTQAIKQEQTTQPTDADSINPDVSLDDVPDEREQLQDQNPLVRRAIQQQAKNQKSARTDEGIDQEKPISELMDEDEQETKTQPKQTPPNQLQKEKESQANPQKITLDNPTVTQSKPSSAQDLIDQADEQEAQTQTKQSPSNSSQEKPAQKKEKKPDVDISEMFNFSKRN